MEFSAIASMMDLPNEGLLHVVFQILSFLKSNHNCVPVFDPSKPEIDQLQFPTEDWSATPYGNCKEDVSSNVPTPRVMGFL